VVEPSFASLRAVEVYAAGPRALAQRDAAWEQILHEVVPREIRGDSGSLALTASSGAIYTLMYEQVRRGELSRLPDRAPTLAYLALSPLIGSDEAAAIATRSP